MEVKFEVSSIANDLWETAKAKVSKPDGEVAASDVAKHLFLSWVRENAALE